MGSTSQTPWQEYWGTLLYWLAISLKLGLVFAPFSLSPFFFKFLKFFFNGKFLCVSVPKRISQVIRHAGALSSEVHVSWSFCECLWEGFTVGFVLHAFPGSLCFVQIVLFFPGSAHADILKPACTQDCIGQVHSSVASVGMNTYRACKW